MSTASLSTPRRSRRSVAFRLSVVTSSVRMKVLLEYHFQTGAEVSLPHAEKCSKLAAALAGVVGRRVRLELFAPRKRADNDGIETRVAHELRRNITRRVIVARQ